MVPRIVGLIVSLTVVTATIAPAVSRAQTSARPDSTGTLFGVITMRDGGFPLAYSVVSIPALGRERFTNDQGAFVIGELPAGAVQLHVKHLGYTPVDLTVSVHAGRADTVHVELTHIAVRLTAMQVRAYPECKNPGVPAAASDSAFAIVFDQLRQNADQYRLLTDTYPFVYSVERMMMNTLVDGESRIEKTDTITMPSRNGWTYRPGTVVSTSFLPRGRSETTMNIPTLLHFADPTFLANHCFYNGGLETVDGNELLRVDLIAASRISAPDVNGSMYLDPTTFQIRRSVLRLSKIPRGMTGLRETEAVTYFNELFPSIPVVAGIMSVNRLDLPPRPARDAVAEAHEQQRLLSVHFLKGMPGEDTKKP